MDFWTYFAFLRVKPLHDITMYRQYFILRGHNDITAKRIKGDRRTILHTILRGFLVRREPGSKFRGVVVDGSIHPLEILRHHHTLDNGDRLGDVSYNAFLQKKCTESATQEATKYSWDPRYRRIILEGREEVPKADLPDDFPGDKTLQQHTIARMSVCHWALPLARYSRSIVLPSHESNVDADLDLDEYGIGDDDGYNEHDLEGTQCGKVLALMAEARAAAVSNGRNITEREVFCSAMRHGELWASSRMVQVVRRIHEHIRQRPGKVLVFSEYITALDVLRIGLKKSHDYECIEYNGRLTASTRTHHVKQFQLDPSIETQDGLNKRRIMLVSTFAGGVGLTLTAADGVFMLNLPWTPALLEQAFKRAHRIGQTRKVTAHTFMVTKSLEAWILLTEKEKGIQSRQIVQSTTMDTTENRRLLKKIEDMRKMTREEFFDMVCHLLFHLCRDQLTISRPVSSVSWADLKKTVKTTKKTMVELTDLSGGGRHVSGWLHCNPLLLAPLER